MDDDGSLSIRNWGFYETMKGNLGLQLMPSVAGGHRDTKPLLPNGTFLQHHNAPHHPPHSHHPRDYGNGEPSGGMPTEPPAIHMDFVRNEAWMHPSQHQHQHQHQHHHQNQHQQQHQHQHQHSREQKVLHAVPLGPPGHIGHPGHAVHHHPTDFGMMPDARGAHTLQMMQPQEPPVPEEEKIAPPLVEEHSVVGSKPLVKKRQQGRQPKLPKPKKPKKVATPGEDGAPKARAPRSRGPLKPVEMVINGIDFDISRIPTPVCSCTGAPQQCYRWGAGGWQSACCTTSISTYPLPMNTKRRGARIAGRKMSQGAFKKVLEKLAGEGYNLNNPIDLKTFWAKHGTNKFVTIR